MRKSRVRGSSEDVKNAMRKSFKNSSVPGLEGVADVDNILGEARNSSTSRRMSHRMSSVPGLEGLTDPKDSIGGPSQQHFLSALRHVQSTLSAQMESEARVLREAVESLHKDVLCLRSVSGARNFAGTISPDPSYTSINIDSAYPSPSNSRPRFTEAAMPGDSRATGSTKSVQPIAATAEELPSPAEYGHDTDCKESPRVIDIDHDLRVDSSILPQKMLELHTVEDQTEDQAEDDLRHGFLQDRRPSVASHIALDLPESLTVSLAFAADQTRAGSMTTTGSGYDIQSRSEAIGHFASIKNSPTDDGEESRQFSIVSQPTTRVGVVLPDSVKRNMWDIVSFCVLLFDTLVIPYTLAWQTPDSAFLITTTWMTMCFWTADMVLTFNTALYKHGELEVRRWPIAKHYFKTTFMLDLVVTGNDWISTIMALLPDKALAGDDPFSSFLRFMKGQRMLRLAKLVRFSTIFSRLREQFNKLVLSEALSIFFQVAAVTFGIFLVSHITCCIWYAIGRGATQDTGVSWLDTTEMTPLGERTYASFSTLYQYSTAYHWSVVQMFMGSVQINARNTKERLFNIFCNIFGTFFSAIITSWLAALLVKHQGSKVDYEEVMKSVRRYLREHEVSPSVAIRVQKQLALRLQARKRYAEEDISAFQLLSKALKAEMREDILSKFLMNSPLLYLCNQFDVYDGVFILNLCSRLRCYALGLGDEVFPVGMSASEAHILLHGTLAYFPPSDYIIQPTSFNGLPLVPLRGQEMVSEGCSRCFVRVPPGTWLSEAAMLMDWVTRGHAEASLASELISISREVIEVVTAHARGSIFAAYRKSYSSLFMTAPSETLNDIDPPLSHALVILVMNCAARVAVAQPVLLKLKELRRRQWLQAPPIKDASDLEEEVRQGECALIFSDDGNPTRVALIVCLKLVRDDGLMFAQVAKMGDGCLVPKLQFPSTKVKEGEGPASAAQRLLNLKLSEFGVAGDLGAVTEDQQIKVTETYGLETRFLRTVFDVPFTPSNYAMTRHEEPMQCAAPVRFARPKDDSPKRCESGTKASVREARRREFFEGGLNELALDAEAPPGTEWELLPDQFYVVPEDGNIYAWIDPDTFEALAQGLDLKTVETWVDQMAKPLIATGQIPQAARKSRDQSQSTRTSNEYTGYRKSCDQSQSTRG